MTNKNLYLISFYVPEDNLEQVKNSLFAIGAGQLGNYSCCAWQTKGEGQFCPEHGSTPYLGQIGKITKVTEYKVELICEKQYLRQAIIALKQSHPYEQPAYSIVKIDNY